MSRLNIVQEITKKNHLNFGPLNLLNTVPNRNLTLDGEMSKNVF